MVLLIVEFVSIFLLIISLLLLLAVLLKHFKGMDAPAHWVYYLGAFSLLAISSAYTRLFAGDFAFLDAVLRLVANISIFLGSYEIFRRYETRVSKTLNIQEEPKEKAEKRKVKKRRNKRK